MIAGARCGDVVLSARDVCVSHGGVRVLDDVSFEIVDRIRAAVEEALGPAPVEIDELIRQLRAPAAAVVTVILELELAGRCRRHPGNRVSWC